MHIVRPVFPVFFDCPANSCIFLENVLYFLYFFCSLGKLSQCCSVISFTYCRNVHVSLALFRFFELYAVFSFTQSYDLDHETSIFEDIQLLLVTTLNSQSATILFRRSVPRTVFQSLVSCLVLLWLDYCNAVLAGIRLQLAQRLQ